MKNNMFYEGRRSFAPGTPFDPYGTDDRLGSRNARVMPTQFLLSYQPVRFSLLRNTVPDDEETTGSFFY